MDFNDRLKQLQEQIFAKKNLETKRRELESQRENLRSRAQELEKILWNEQADVDRLEHTSMASIFYSMMGKKEVQLDKERVEAFAAKVKYDSAVQELQLVENDIHDLEVRLQEMVLCEKQYQELLARKAYAIKESASETAQQLLTLEEKMAELQSQKKEIREAIAAGSSALTSIQSILSDLDAASGFGAWDLMGGGMLSGIAKHSYLDEAQGKVQQLQSELRRFKTELADITIQADLQVGVDGFLRFSDYFFDGVFADWVVMDQINQSQSSVQDVKKQVEAVLSRLHHMAAATDQQIAALENQKNSVIAFAEI